MDNINTQKCCSFLSMLVFSGRFTQWAPVICKIDVSCITTQQIVYQPVDVPSSVSKPGMKSVSCLRFLAYASSLKNWVLGRGVCIYTYPGGTPSILECWAPSLSTTGAGGISGGCCGGSGRGEPVLLNLQSVWGFLALLFWQRGQPSVWSWWTIAGCLAIAASTFSFQGNSTPHFNSSRALVRGYSIRYNVSSLAVCKHPHLAILAIFNAGHMSDCFRCSWPPWLAMVADMLKTYKKLVAASESEIQLLPQPYTTL